MPSLIVNLPTAALPSTLGWTYNGNVPETPSWQVIGSGLEMNTLGGPSGLATGAYYQQPWSGAGMVEILWRMQVLGYEGSTSPALGVYFGANDGTRAYLMGFSDTSVVAYNAATAALNTTQVHDYRLVIDPGVGMSLYLDGSAIPFLSGVGVGNIRSPDLEFGDGTSFGNAHILLLAPEPATNFAVGGALAALAALAYRRRCALAS